MPEVLTRTPETQHERSEGPEARRATSSLQSSSAFKYYIHDSIATLRLQLVGELRASNVTELNGSWETAKTTLGQRRLVLDLGQLYSTDEEGRRWLAKMMDGGAACLPVTYFQTGERPSARQARPETPAVKLSLIGRVLGLVRGESPARPER